MILFTYLRKYLLETVLVDTQMCKICGVLNITQFNLIFEGIN